MIFKIKIFSKNIVEIDDNEFYNINLNLKEIGMLVGLTESRVSQLHTAGLQKLQKKLKDILTE